MFSTALPGCKVLASCRVSIKEVTTPQQLHKLPVFSCFPLSLRVQSNMAVVVEGGMAEQLPHQSFVRIVLSPESRVA